MRAVCTNGAGVTPPPCGCSTIVPEASVNPDASWLHAPWKHTCTDGTWHTSIDTNEFAIGLLAMSRTITLNVMSPNGHTLRQSSANEIGAGAGTPPSAGVA